MRKVFTNLNIHDRFMSKTISVFNDNMACVQWSKNRTTRTIRHIQLRDNAVRENVRRKLIDIQHIPGATNIADIFTKEDRDKNHFISLREKILFPHFRCHNTIYNISKFNFNKFRSVRLDILQATGGVS